MLKLRQYLTAADIFDILVILDALQLKESVNARPFYFFPSAVVVLESGRS